MKTRKFITILLSAMVLSAAQATYVTVHGTVGMLDAELVDYQTMERVGTVEIYNDRYNMYVVVKPFADRCLLSKVQVYLSTEPAPPPVPPWYEDTLEAMEVELSEMNDLNATLTATLTTLAADSADYSSLSNQIASLTGEIVVLTDEYNALMEEYLALCVAPDFGEWPYKVKFKKNLQDQWTLTVPLDDIEGLEWGPWGVPWLDQRLATVAVRAELKTTDTVPVTFTACAHNQYVPFEGQRTSWSANMLAQRYELQHPSHGQFEGPVHGLIYVTSTHRGTTGNEGGFSFYPGETVSLWIGDVYLGAAVADQRISPLDLFPGQEISDPSVVNLARLLLALDRDGEDNKTIQITDESLNELVAAMESLGIDALDFGNSATIDELILLLGEVSAENALAWLEGATGSRLMRRNISKSPEYAVDKPKLDIMPVYVPAKSAAGDSTSVEYKDEDGNIVSTRGKVKPLFVTYTEEQEPNPSAGIHRRGSDIITAVSMDDGATWKRFNVSHMARKSSFMLDSGERFPGNSRGPRQKIVDDKIMVVWTSAFTHGGKPSFAIKADDDYPHDDAYAVNDIWGVRGRQGSVNYNEDKDVGSQGIGEIPYYALWACRGVLVWDGNAADFPEKEIGDVVWFKPERLTSGRRDAFFAMLHGARNVGFAVAWQEDPGGLLPGSCKGGGHGWSGATVHKKTDIWYSYLRIEDFDKIDPNWDPDAAHSGDEHSEEGPDDHGQQPEISNRPKWLVPMSLAVRVSDNAVVNTENMKVELDPDTGLPLIDPVTGTYIKLEGALEEDFKATEHEDEGGCDDTDDDHDHSDHGGRGGGWGMARYAYELPELGIVDLSPDRDERIWDEEVDGDYIPASGMRWTRFINKPGELKTVAVTADGRELDGNTGACRPSLQVQSGGWVILGYEETKGLGIPPEGEHGEDTDTERPEPDDKGKNIIYHSFKFDQPDRISAGHILNLPALDDSGELIPIYYKDAEGESTGIVRQYKTETARRIRFITQPKSKMGASRTVMLAAYRQGREGNGKPSDVFVVRGVVPPGDTGNPYKFDNLQRYDTGADTTDTTVMKGQRRHMNMSAATVESIDPVEQAGDGEGNSWHKVGKWKQYHGNMTDESFANPYSSAKAHRGFIRGDTIVFGYSFTPNWGRLGGDHMDFFVRRSFDGGKTYTTDPDGPEEVVHEVIERDPDTGEFSKKQYQYQRGAFEPARNVSLLKGNKYTVEDPRLVPPMKGGSTVNKTYPEDDAQADGLYYVAFGTAEVLHGIGEPLGMATSEKRDIFYSRTTDGGSTWLMVPWDINPDSSSPDAGETVYRWPWLAQGGPHQGHAQIRMHPSGNRLYAIWHQFTHGDEWPLSPHDVGNDIWFRRIDFMDADE
jgi:hypothetical protein